MAEPLPTCFLNGQFLPWQDARISPFDRAFLYGDGVYEVMPVYAGRPFRFAAHCERLTHSLRSIQMANPHTNEEWRSIITSLIERNGSGNQYVYWQVTRGAERGRHHAPLPEIPRTVFAFCAPLPPITDELRATGVNCVTAPDNRWSRCDIKSTALLANVLLRQLACEAGAVETIVLADGQLVEGSSSAVLVVIGGELRAPPQSHHLLPSITRVAIEELAERASIARRAVAVSEAELRGADEIILASATREAMPVSRLDGRPVGAGRPGPVWQRIHGEFEKQKRKLAGAPW